MKLLFFKKKISFMDLYGIYNRTYFSSSRKPSLSCNARLDPISMSFASNAKTLSANIFNLFHIPLNEGNHSERAIHQETIKL